MKGCRFTLFEALVERQTRYVMLFRPQDNTAESVRVALTATVKKLPEHLWTARATNATAIPDSMMLARDELYLLSSTPPRAATHTATLGSNANNHTYHLNLIVNLPKSHSNATRRVECHRKYSDQ
jgi:hypothetical protein